MLQDTSEMVICETSRCPMAREQDDDPAMQSEWRLDTIPSNTKVGVQPWIWKDADLGTAMSPAGPEKGVRP